MKLHQLEDSYLAQLRGLQDTEKELLKAAPRVPNTTLRLELKSVVETHARQTRQQVHWLEQFMQRLIDKRDTESKDQSTERQVNRSTFGAQAGSEFWDQMYF